MRVVTALAALAASGHAGVVAASGHAGVVAASGRAGVVAAAEERARAGDAMELRRADGVRIGYDPYDPRIAARYGLPGQTDDEGFDPYSDTVGPGIYGTVIGGS